MIESTDWTLLARYLSGECSEAEKARVEAWIALNPENQRIISSMKRIWDIPEPQVEKSDDRRLWGEVSEKLDAAAGTESAHARERRTVVRDVAWLKPQVRTIWRYAAAAVLLIAASFAYFQKAGVFPWGRQTGVFRTLAVQNGARQELVLSDGTRITLDAGSRLRYPERFNGDTREVDLTGEGYFSVASSAGKPFTVHANHAVVTVLGTRFNVRAWEPDGRVTVAVAEGKVSLGSGEPAQGAVVITKGKASTLAKGRQPSEPIPVDVEKCLSWMQKEAFFNDAPLREVLYQLERWYDVRFDLEDASIASERLTVHLQAKSLDDVLELVSALTGLDCQRTNGSIRLRPRH